MSNDIAENTLVAQIATMALDQIYTSGKVSQNEIHKKLGISRHQVRKIINSTEYVAYFDEINRQATMGAVAAIKGKVEGLAPMALEALKHNLSEKKMDAVNTYFKLLGIMDHKTDDRPSDNSIQIIMPGQAPVTKDIEVGASDEQAK